MPSRKRTRPFSSRTRPPSSPGTLESLADRWIATGLLWRERRKFVNCLARIGARRKQEDRNGRSDPAPALPRPAATGHGRRLAPAPLLEVHHRRSGRRRRGDQLLLPGPLAGPGGAPPDRDRL